MKTLNIRYKFTFPSGKQQTFDLLLDPETLILTNPTCDPFPDWTRLEFHQCEICPLQADQFPHCPVALHLKNIVEDACHTLSYDIVDVEVITEERVISQNTSAQRGISSLMGLVMASSGCPVTAFFKPMARFHLPFASTEETVFRAAAMYRLAQYLRKKDGLETDQNFTGLMDIYENVRELNMAMADRLREAAETDAAVNAVVVLDAYAQAMSFVIEDQLDQMRPVFQSFLSP